MLRTILVCAAVLLAGTSPVYAENCVDAGAERSVVVKQDADSAFRVHAHVGGNSVLLMVDTGSYDIGLTPVDAKRLKVKYNKRDGRLDESANGDALVYPVTIPSVRIGCIELKDVEASVMPKMAGESILGMSFLSRIEWSYRAGVLTLVQPASKEKSAQR